MLPPPRLLLHQLWQPCQAAQLTLCCPALLPRTMQVLQPLMPSSLFRLYASIIRGLNNLAGAWGTLPLPCMPARCMRV